MYCPACGHQNLPGSDACEKCMLPLAPMDGPTPHDRVQHSLMTDPVSVLDPRPPVTVPADVGLGVAVQLMMDRKVGAVLVTAADGTLTGVLTERDFLTKVAGEVAFATFPVARFMTPKPETVLATSTLAFALSKMDAGGYRHLPVVEGGKPVGVISVRDILRHLMQLCQE